MGDESFGDLADYLKRQNPRRRGLSKRNLYNMVKFYDVYSRPIFIDRISQLNINEFVQLQTAQIQDTTIVQLPTAQLETTNNKQIPALLTITTFTNHVEIMNRCRSDEERIFYMLYARHQGLKTEELRRCIVNQTFSSLMDKEKMMSPKLLADYPQSEFMLKDKAVVDFLNLPEA